MKLNLLNSELYKSLDKKYNYSSKISNLIIIILLTVNFTLLAINGLNNASDPQGWDTAAYLGEANFIKHHGGLINFLNLCFTGKWEQANQHPLYILFLTPFASINISFFIIAKIISAVIGFGMLLTLYIICKKAYGNIVASFAVFAIILNAEFIEWTTWVACESLLILVSFLCIFFIMKGFKNNKYWIYAGIFAGLSYLTKGTSLLLLPGFVISAIIIYRLKILKNKFFWSFFIFFTLTASPLLIRNTVLYQVSFL